MRLDELLTRPALISHLRETFGAGRVYHAYVFTGPEGVGKRTAARLCAQALFCRAEPGARPCGVCAGCRQFAEGHPDVYRLEVPEGKTQIPVTSVRDLTAALSDRPFSGGWRAVLIEDAERMNASAQNALLKTLEEPPEGTVFLLTVRALGALLPTVVSRCQVVRFAPLPEETIRAELVRRGAQENDARWIAEISEGSLGKALGCMADDRLPALMREAQAAWEAARAGKGLAAAANCIKVEKDEADEALDLFEGIGRGLIRKGDAAGARLIGAVMEARKMVKSNVTWQYALERMLMSAAER